MKKPKKGWAEGFDDGVIACCTYLVNGHGEDSLAKFLLECNGFKREDIKKLQPYDRIALKDTFKRLR